MEIRISVVVHKEKIPPGTGKGSPSEDKQRGNTAFGMEATVLITEYPELPGTQRIITQLLATHPNHPTLGIPGSVVQAPLELWQP